ncbi:U6 snRNA phosphodiesterase [Hypsizygus marmoreus]|uniref:U6 snRNA phosphodiesterase n=1 Tax=Hypsizygus marmoreus TaxID=39966 RepID=A0A369J7J8_HYPMA|nr:U6 snRNA phosphodiesterase [Hypsizygus marmoreus]
MKRASQTLVTYSSSEDEDQPPVKKKRKLPSLSPSLLLPVPTDNPTLHQGRVRSQPHVEGQWVAHIYVSLIVERRSNLHKLLDVVLGEAKVISPTLHDFWPTGEPSKKHELHISLSRPIYLRTHQREGLKAAVKSLSRQFPPFPVSFATFSELVNDERTRTFLALEVGAGHHELRAMSNALTPTLHAIRQKEFYEDPHFHASIAWALLDRPAPSQSLIADVSPTLTEGTLSPSHAVSVPPERVPEADFPTVTQLPEELVRSLNHRYSSALSSTKTGIFDVEEIAVKIGKEVYTWQLSG